MFFYFWDFDSFFGLFGEHFVDEVGNRGAGNVCRICLLFLLYFLVQLLVCSVEREFASDHHVEGDTARPEVVQLTFIRAAHARFRRKELV